MRKFLFEKIVPPNVYKGMLADGSIPEVVELDSAELYTRFIQKIIEEANEALRAPQVERADELINLRAALAGAEKASGCTDEELAAAESRQAVEKGDFWPPVYVKTLEVTDDNPWISHFEANPDRYIEIVE